MVNLKTPEFQAAKEALFGFLKKNKLNIFTDYSKDPLYGPEYRLLLAKFQLERDKILIDYPNRDFKNRKKYFKMKKDKKAKEAAKKAAEEKTAKKAVKSTEKKASKEKTTEKKARVAKYDYPQIDGREMTAEEKKKYRAEQRKAAKGADKGTEKKASKEKSEKTEKKASKASKDKTPKEKAKPSKKAKKAAKDED